MLTVKLGPILRNLMIVIWDCLMPWREISPNSSLCVWWWQNNRFQNTWVQCNINLYC